MSNSTFSTGKSLLAGLGTLALVVVVGWFGIELEDVESPEVHQESSVFVDGLEICERATLPKEADLVIDDILSGGPYAYPGEDGGHFGNYEDVLPDERNSYYRSYTVDTPGLNRRGAKRIVVGGGTEEDPEVWYYSDDHYESFCEIPDAED